MDQGVSRNLRTKRSSPSLARFRGDPKVIQKRLRMLCPVDVCGSEGGLILGPQQVVDGKSKEFTAIPKLTELREIKGRAINLDTTGCQQKNVAQIIEKIA